MMLLVSTPAGFFIGVGEALAKVPAEPVDIEADVVTYEQDNDRYTASGKVKVTFSALVLTADHLVLDMPSNEVRATGQVKLTSADDILEGDMAVFDIDKGTGVIHQGSAFLSKNHFYLRGSKIEKTGEHTYRALDARATTCDDEAPDWQIAGSELEVTIDGYGKLKHGRFLVKNLPVFYLPYMIFPAKTTRQSGFLLPSITHSRDIHGWDVEAPYFIALSEDTDATLYLRYLERSGLKMGLEYRYFQGDNSSGTVYGDFLQDQRAIKESYGAISRDWPDGAERWSLYWQHETAFSPTSYLRLDLFRLSDIWYFRDFTSRNYYLNSYGGKPEERFRRISFKANESLTALESTARIVHKFDFHYVNFLMRHTDDLTSQTNDATLQKYPELSFGGARQTISDSPLQYDWNGSLSYNYRQKGQRGYTAELAPMLYLPLNVGGVLSVLPEVGLRETYWSRDDEISATGAKAGGRTLYNLALKLSTDFHRVFDIGGDRVEKIRHSVKPEVTYQYTPDVEQGNLPDFVPQVAATNSITYALTNFLVARERNKEGVATYRDYLRLKLSQTYDVREASRNMSAQEERRPLGDAILEFDLNPDPHLSFSARNNYDVYQGRWRQSNYDLALRDKRGDALGLGYRYTKDIQEELNLSLKAVVNKYLDLTYLYRRNLQDGKDLEKTIGLSYRKQCWMVEFNYSVKELDTLFMFNVSLYGLGKFGIW
ncbi:MAG: LPS assembly protein LptD [Smithellaceae bacterium]|nr:LPS assembly protein LptD [Smithellaceae bacterium]